MGSSSREDSASDGDTVSRDKSPASTNLFTEGERVLAYHGPRIYEAKVQKAEIRKKERRYFVHYLGWNKNWDEWVGADRLLKNTEENIMKQKALDLKQGVDKSSKSGRSAQSKPKSSAGPKGKKRKPDSGVEKDSISADKLVKIQIPSTLKKQLVDDWEFVMQQDKFVKLPRSPSVDDILTKYTNRMKKDNSMAHSAGEVLKGVQLYFDKVLPAMLLYKNERQQYNDAMKHASSPSKVYGAEHLLRLFVKLPELLASVKIEEETLTTVQQILTEFLKHLQKNQSSFFLSSYEGSKVSETKAKEKTTNESKK